MTNVDDKAEANLDESPPAEAVPSSDAGSVPSQQGSDSGVVSREEFEAFKNEYVGRVSGLQGAWDKQTDALKKRMEALGVELTPQQQQANVLLDMQERIDALTSPSPQQQPATETVPTPLNYAEVIKAQELDANNPEVLNAAIKFQNDPTAFKAALVDIKASKTHALATPAAVVTPGSASAPSATSLEEANRAVNDLLSDRSTLTTEEGRAKLAEARKQLEELEKRG